MAVVLGLAAVLLVVWPYLVPGPGAETLAADVNRAYRQVPGFTWTQTTDGASQGHETTRVTQLDDGIVVGLTEEVGVQGQRPLQTIVTGDRIWITVEERGCWSPGGSSDGLGIGAPVIPIDGVRFEKARRSGTEWTLVAHQAVESVDYRTEYFIDPDSLLIVRTERTITGAPTGDVTQTMTFGTSPAAPAIVAPTKICGR